MSSLLGDLYTFQRLKFGPDSTGRPAARPRSYTVGSLRDHVSWSQHAKKGFTIAGFGNIFF
eukprot:6308953-Alexandrium_andersonii.AAC.1